MIKINIIKHNKYIDEFFNILELKNTNNETIDTKNVLYEKCKEYLNDYNTIFISSAKNIDIDDTDSYNKTNRILKCLQDLKYLYGINTTIKNNKKILFYQFNNRDELDTFISLNPEIEQVYTTLEIPTETLLRIFLKRQEEMNNLSF